MKLLSYGLDHRMEPRLAFLLNGYAIDVMRAALWMKEDRGAQDFLNLASSLKLALENWSRSFALLKDLESAFQTISFEKLTVYNRSVALPTTEIVFFAPVADAPGLRCFQSCNPENPASFVFGNSQTLIGHQQTLTHSGLAAQVEIAAFIAADKDGGQPSVAGYCVANNWHATETDQDDGLAWGKATSLGPCMVTADELETHKLGSGFNLDFQLRVNGQATGEGRFKEMKIGFSEMIQQASPTNVQAGDVFCSGTPSDLSGVTASAQGDQVDIEIQALGILSTTIA